MCNLTDTIACFADNILRQLGNLKWLLENPRKRTPAWHQAVNAHVKTLRSKYRTAVKNVEKAVLAGDKTKATELFAKMQAVVDTIADKGIFHKNKAARDKSRLSTKVKALALA
ncbi:MAG: ribosomal protein [Pseudomonadota bacterium]